MYRRRCRRIWNSHGICLVLTPNGMTRSSKRPRSSKPAWVFLSDADDSHARSYTHCSGRADGHVRRAGTRAKRHHERQLQHYGSGEGVQTFAAGALAGAEIQIAARDREARDHPEDDDRVAAEHAGPPGSLDRAYGAELANAVRVGT